MNRRQLARTCTLEAIASVENLMLAAWKARRGKSRRPDVEDWCLRRESEVLRLREELRSGAYQPGGSCLPGRSQESSLTAAPAPVGVTGKDAVAAVPGKPGLKGTAALLAQPLAASAPASPAPLPPLNQ